MRQQISGYISIEIHQKLKSHPLRGSKTLAAFYEYAFEQFLESPESKLAMKQREFENERLQRGIWSRRAEELEAQLSELGAERSAVAPGVAAPAVPAPVSEEPEGDFAATIRRAAADDSPSRTAVDLTLAAPDGKTFPDRMIDFPPSARAVYFRKALGIDDSIAKTVADLPGRTVLVRRMKNPDSSGPRFLTYYYPMPASAIH